MRRQRRSTSPSKQGFFGLKNVCRFFRVWPLPPHAFALSPGLCDHLQWIQQATSSLAHYPALLHLFLVAGCLGGLCDPVNIPIRMLTQGILSKLVAPRRLPQRIRSKSDPLGVGIFNTLATRPEHTFRSRGWFHCWRWLGLGRRRPRSVWQLVPRNWCWKTPALHHPTAGWIGTAAAVLIAFGPQCLKQLRTIRRCAKWLKCFRCLLTRPACCEHLLSKLSRNPLVASSSCILHHCI